MARKKQGGLGRRELVAGASAAALTGALARRAAAAPAEKKTYRVGVIGHTGRGNYGHGLDRVWLAIPGVRIVAVADADKRGLASAKRRLKVDTAYTDYRRMLDEAKCDLVSVCPRWLDQHRDMVIAAAERGVRGIYLEKPMCRSLEEADAMVAACEKNTVKLAIAFQTRYGPKIPVIQGLLKSGRIGRVLEFRGRGKEDRRGGGEDLWVLGTHVMDLIRLFGGDAVRCSASVYKAGRPVTGADVNPGPEGIGPLAGDEVHACYRLASGAMAWFDSVRNAGGTPRRFGLEIRGSKGIIQMFDTGHLPVAHLLADSSWSPGRTGKTWVPISSKGPGQKEPLKDGGLHGGNVLAVTDLIDAVEKDRQPISNIYGARAATEMIVAAFESHRLDGPVALPLKNRKNPLTMLDE